MKISAVIVCFCKFVMASPFLLIGLLFGVIGFGPEGPSTPIPIAEIAGYCLIVRALATAYPFSLIKRRGWANWLIVAISAIPLVHGLYYASTVGWPKTADMLGMTLCCWFFPILAAIDLFLSSILIAKDDKQRLMHTE